MKEEEEGDEEDYDYFVDFLHCCQIKGQHTTSPRKGVEKILDVHMGYNYKRIVLL